MKGDSILIVGSIAIDTIEIGDERYENLLGGSTTYATIAAGKYSDVNIVGIIGSDFPTLTTVIHCLPNWECLKNLILNYQR